MNNKALSLATGLALLMQAAEDPYRKKEMSVGIEGHSNRSEEEIMKAKGLSLWEFKGFSCWALNYKSAMKKYNRFLKK